MKVYEFSVILIDPLKKYGYTKILGFVAAKTQKEAKEVIKSRYLSRRYEQLFNRRQKVKLNISVFKGVFDKENGHCQGEFKDGKLIRTYFVPRPGRPFNPQSR